MRKLESIGHEALVMRFQIWNATIKGALGVRSRAIKKKPLSQ